MDERNATSAQQSAQRHCEASAILVSGPVVNFVEHMLEISWLTEILLLANVHFFSNRIVFGNF